uniref:Secreted protein n=1 Tax=Heterorhabditis bacteriophora TaxID=37862 RepID=A0A1I7WLY0_HETBA
MHWSASIFRSICFLCFFNFAIAADSVIQERKIRNFPYSISLYRMLGHDRELRPYYGADDEVAAIIDSMNTDITPRLRRSREQLKSRYSGDSNILIT